MHQKRSVVATTLTAILAVVATAVVSAAALFWFLRNPVLLEAYPTDAHMADVRRLRADVAFLAGLTPSRNSRNVAVLDEAAAYIEKAFARTACARHQQTFRINRAEYRNIVCSFGPEKAPRLVIGAHYDVYGENNPGADDNASGVAGILELARLISMKKPKLRHRLDLVAFTLEEPPHFRSTDMGSYVYARGMMPENMPLKLMISVEMIGYFSDQPNSQSYPLGLLAWFYPDRANYIAVVGRAFDRSIVARVKMLMSATERLPVYSINAPTRLRGVDFSDHWSFWQHGLPAVMVTDTAFYRNANYHAPTDTPDTLDYRRMGMVVDGLYRVAVRY